MPDPISANINSKAYVIPILNGEMDAIAQQIYTDRDELRSLRNHITSKLTDLNNNYNTLLLMYIQNTGQYPS